MAFYSLNTPRQVRCHPRFLLVEMLVKFYQHSQRGYFTNLGKLTDTKLRAMKPNGNVQKEFDGDGLYAYIGAKGKSISWQMGYRFENKQKVLTLGRYPEVSLVDARKKALKRGKCLRMDTTPAWSISLKKRLCCLPRKKRR